jgi:release factor glutamine methyltransferase
VSFILYNKKMKVTDVLKQVTLILGDAGLEEPGREAMALVREIAGLEPTIILAHAPELAEEVTGKIMEAAGRRAGREPIQYITGRMEFMDMVLSVGPGVLVPRPETELLVEKFCHLFTDQGARLEVLDLCTGSGCIALSIASHYPNAKITATDASRGALKYALANANNLDIRNVSFLEGSLYQPLREETYDAIVSNPPYIPTGEIDSLMPEVSRFEPRPALDGGEDGLDFYRAIIQGAQAHLKPGGFLIFELGAGQHAEVEAAAIERGFSLKEVIKDPAGHERVMVLAC